MLKIKSTPKREEEMKRVLRPKEMELLLRNEVWVLFRRSKQEGVNRRDRVLVGGFNFGKEKKLTLQIGEHMVSFLIEKIEYENEHVINIFTRKPRLTLKLINIKRQAVIEAKQEAQREAERSRKQAKLVVHKDIRIKFKIEDRHFEAVGFLDEIENSVSSDEMFFRTDGQNGEAIGRYSVYYISNRRNKLPKKLRDYTLVTTWLDPWSPRIVECFRYNISLGWCRYSVSCDWHRGTKNCLVVRVVHD